MYYTLLDIWLQLIAHQVDKSIDFVQLYDYSLLLPV